jgi:outer membrane receptor for ferrienterochelin and colicins
MKSIFFIFSFLLSWLSLSAQNNFHLKGKVNSKEGAVINASIKIAGTTIGTISDVNGNFNLSNLKNSHQMLVVSAIGYLTKKQTVHLSTANSTVTIFLENDDFGLNEIVVTGTMKEMSRSDSPIPVEVITPQLFKKNPTPTLFEAIGMVNGVQPQLNCNVCNTGDIHINGMEGPYTMILIDGMPIVSALSTVYGLNGIPNSMVERIEVVKGPASSLYGSEAMGGIINVITKNPDKAPLLSADVFSTSWGELSADAAIKFNTKKTTSLFGVNYFNYQNKTDNNKDNFTDLTLQNRISLFNKWNFNRKDDRAASVAARYVYEDRWGGEMNWNKSFRGSNTVYGESIYTSRAEVIGLYQIPSKERIFTQYSYNWHKQDSWYGDTKYLATQHVGFIQSYWDKPLNDKHNLLLGASFRFTEYDDNTPATADSDGIHNQPSQTPLPGIFIQDEWKLDSLNTLLAGYRYDYDKNHGSIHSPRIAYKLSPNKNHTLRASFGTGFRVVNLFTEDHAALTGARQVIINEELNPEKSFNGNLNYVLKIPTENVFMGFDITGFYSYFTNKIIADFDKDQTKIIYENINGHAITRGVSLNTDFAFTFPLKVLAGISYMDVFQKEDGVKIKQLHAPKWSGTLVSTYSFNNKWSVDLTGNWYGPMRLPTLPNDFRPEYSPWFLIANLQVNKKFDNGMEIYGGVKNLLNFIPKNPIMRPFDPFNNHVGDVASNPYGYTFDPSYNYASLQGARSFLGVRYNLFK